MKKFVLLFAVSFCFLIGAWANKTSVELKTPTDIKAGTEVTITISVMHSSNSRSHHTEWVYLMINGKEVQRWSYTREQLPPDAEFTVEYKFTPTEDSNIEAKGNCNIHGSKGAQTASLKVSK